MYRRWGCELRPSGFNPACLWPCLSTSPVEMAGTKAQAAAVILGHHRAPVLYGGNACLGATHHLREHRTAPAYECTALACVLQPLEGGQAAIPSPQLDSATVALFLAFAANARQCPLKVTCQRRCKQAQSLQMLFWPRANRAKGRKSHKQLFDIVIRPAGFFFSST